MSPVASPPGKRRSLLGPIGLALGLLGFATAGLSVLPGLICSILAAARSKDRLPWAGIIVCVPQILGFSLFPIPRWLPGPCQHLAFRMTMPGEFSALLSLDGYDRVSADKRNWMFGGTGGVLRFAPRLRRDPTALRQDLTAALAARGWNPYPTLSGHPEPGGNRARWQAYEQRLYLQERGELFSRLWPDHERSEAEDLVFEKPTGSRPPGAYYRVAVHVSAGGDCVILFCDASR